MKNKIISFVFVCILLASVVICAASCSEGERRTEKLTLYVYNWGEYISDGSEESLDVNAAFEDYCRETLGLDVTVNYSTYASNEDMYAKLSSGAVSYDVIIPSDYMIARLAAEGLLCEVNPAENIENYKYISDDFKGLYYDTEEKYSVPYTYGTVGVIYNPEMLKDENGNLPDTLGSWALLWDENFSGNILQFNNPRDGFGTAQYYLGYSVNSEDEDEWRDALRLLIEQKNVVQGYVMDEIFNKMKGGSAAVAPYYAGDFFTMYQDNEDLAFYYPSEKTNIFVDAMCIPKCTQNYDLALEYINFMLSEEAAVANAEYICYASPNTLVYENEEYIECMEEMYPGAMDVLYGFDRENTEFYYDLPDDTRNLMNSLWEELKIESTIGTEIYVICAVIVALIIILFAARFITVKRRAHYFKKYSK